MGRLTRDPEVRYTAGENALAIARYTLAVDRRFRRDGEATADFISCVVFGRGAEFAEKYFHQGNPYCGKRPDPDRKLHQQRRTEGIYYGSSCRRAGICGE